MTALFLKLARLSLEAGWAAIFVMVLRLALKKAPRWISCALWALVALRLVCPIAFESPASIVPAGDSILPDQAVIISTVQPSPAQSDRQPVTAQPSAAESTPSPALDMAQIASILWAVGVAAMTGYMLLSFARLRAKMATATLAEKGVYRTEFASSPFILGVLRPRIYLPYSLPEGDIPLVLAHERAHLKRGDHLIKPAAFTLLAVYWFNPLLWVSYWLLCRDIEVACDEKAVKLLDEEDRRAYSSALLACAVNERLISACPLSFGETDVKERVIHVKKYKKPALWVIAMALCLCAAAAFLLTGNRQAQAVPSLEGIAGRKYAVKEIVYDDPRYNFSYTVESTPKFSVTEDGRLLITEIKVMGTQYARDFGQLEGFAPDKNNFDQMILYAEEFMAKDPSQLRKTFASAHRSARYYPESDRGEFWYLMKAQDGLYIAFGYADRDGEPESIRWIFRAEDEGPAASYQEVALSELDGSIAKYSFTIPEAYPHAEDWVIFVTAVSQAPDGSTSFTHLYEDMNQTHSWEPGKTYYIYGQGEATLYLTAYLPSGQGKGSYYRVTENMASPRLSPPVMGDFALEPIIPEEYAAGQVDALFRAMESVALPYSNPKEYIDRFPDEYKKILSMGDATIEYIALQFSLGGQTGLHGHLMSRALQDIAPEEAIGVVVNNGQEYFDEWITAMKNLWSKNGVDFMAENYPAGYAALHAIYETRGQAEYTPYDVTATVEAGR